MDKLSDNYYFRKCFMKRKQVPTQSVMKKTMSPALAAVYFKTMTPQLKVIAGLAPPLKGGGNDWYQPPQEILQGRAVLKPVKKEYLKQLSQEGIDAIGMKILQTVYNKRAEAKIRTLKENDTKWKQTIAEVYREKWEECAKEAAQNNTKIILQNFEDFTIMFCSSINNLDEILMTAAGNEVQLIKAEAYKKMDENIKILIKQQATMLHNRYIEKLNNEKARLKTQFSKKIDDGRIYMSNQIHDLSVEKRVLVEKLRHLLESRNLACQIYVALKEREECAKELELLQHEQKKQMKKLKEQLEMRDFEIRLEQEKEKKRQELRKIWQKKICHIVNKFQKFVSFSLNALPDHADFFIDTEKIMMMQLNEAVENPEAQSIFQFEEETIHTPVARPHPFYLCCDKGYKPELDQDLCPKHCTSSASQMPVVVVNKRCIYAACDNFNMFKNKIQKFISGARGDEDDFTDFHKYEQDVPVKLTSSRQLLDLKLESSLLQVLQNELPNATEVPAECKICGIPHCFCSSLNTPKPSMVSGLSIMNPNETFYRENTDRGRVMKSREEELKHEREPKWESYMKYVHPKKCGQKVCTPLMKKYLDDYLPPYMRNMSKFDKPDIPHYEMCDVGTLKRLVKKAQGNPTPPLPTASEPKVHDVGTQYSDQEVDFMCNCFGDSEIDLILDELAKLSFAEKASENFNIGASESPAFLEKHASTFAKDCEQSLVNLMNVSTDLRNIFTNKDFD